MREIDYPPTPGWFNLSKLNLPRRKMEKYAEIQALGQLYQRTAAYQRKYNPIQWENLKEVCAKMDDKICGTCEWYEQENIDGKFVCVNRYSRNCAELTEYGDSCEQWDEKGVKRP